MNDKTINQTLDKITMLAMQLENQIHDLALEACKRGCAYNVHIIMQEHNKINRMVRRLNQIAASI